MLNVAFKKRIKINVLNWINKCRLSIMRCLKRIQYTSLMRLTEGSSMTVMLEESCLDNVSFANEWYAWHLDSSRERHNVICLHDNGSLISGEAARHYHPHRVCKQETRYFNFFFFLIELYLFIYLKNMDWWENCNLVSFIITSMK